jgi:hypothetical protein
MPAALTNPVPISMRLLGSGVALAVVSSVKLTFPFAVLVRLKVPTVGEKPASVKVPFPVTLRKVEVSETMSTGPLIVNVNVGEAVGLKNSSVPLAVAHEKLVRPTCAPR